MRDLESFGGSAKEEKGTKAIIIECKTALSPSSLPGLDLALNPYFGCSHACFYCYAPYVLHQPRDGWGNTVKVKVNIPKVIASEAAKKSGVVGIGTVTDPYQPLEAKFKLTRKCLEELLKLDRPISVLTKSPLVTRDIDLLSKFKSSEVGITVTTQFDDLAAEFEPGAPPPSKRLEAVRKLAEAGANVYVLIGPVLPGITDADLDDFFLKIAKTGARRIIIDKLRLRPGMLARIQTLPMMKNEARWKDFSEKANSDAYYALLSERIYDLCKKHGIECIQAF